VRASKALCASRGAGKPTSINIAIRISRLTEPAQPLHPTPAFAAPLARVLIWLHLTCPDRYLRVYELPRGSCQRDGRATWPPTFCRECVGTRMAAPQGVYGQAGYNLANFLRTLALPDEMER